MLGRRNGGLCWIVERSTFLLRIVLKDMRSIKKPVVAVIKKCINICGSFNMI